jgi:hypothetical protein
MRCSLGNMNCTYEGVPFCVPTCLPVDRTTENYFTTPHSVSVIFLIVAKQAINESNKSVYYLVIGEQRNAYTIRIPCEIMTHKRQ